jgi:hypothetical protein
LCTIKNIPCIDKKIFTKREEKIKAKLCINGEVQKTK